MFWDKASLSANTAIIINLLQSRLTISVNSPIYATLWVLYQLGK